MIDLDRFSQIVNAWAELLPEVIFKGLNLGIGVVERAKRQERSRPERPLFVLGEYRTHGALGRGILLYYGSFMKVFPGLDEAHLTGEIDRVLKHELRHHLEGLAGARDLEIADAAFLQRYLHEEER